MREISKATELDIAVNRLIDPARALQAIADLMTPERDEGEFANLRRADLAYLLDVVSQSLQRNLQEVRACADAFFPNQ